MNRSLRENTAPHAGAATSQPEFRLQSHSDARPVPVSGDVLDFRAARRAPVNTTVNRPAPNRARPAKDGAHRDDLRARRQAPPVTLRAVEAESPTESPCATCPPCHRLLLVFTLLLAVLSIPLVYSASNALALEHYGDPNYFLGRQVFFVLSGVGLLLWASRRSPEQIRRLAWLMYAVALVGLVLIAFTPLGTDLGSGTRRWLKMGPLPAQQFSELAKIALVGVLADFWSRAQRDAQSKFWPWLVTGALSLPMIALVFRQPHLSATLLLCVLPLAIGFYAGAPLKQLGRIALVALAIGAVGFVGMKPYQRERVTSHFAAKEDPRGASYQALQGRRALINGGLLGKGPVGDSYKHGHLPAPHTDFILAVIGEQFGFVGMIFLTALFGGLIFFCFHTGHSSRTGFEALLCAGMGTLLAIQFIGNAGVVTGLLPVTGMPLPIISYGGSGLWCSMLGIGLVLGISRGNGARVEAEAFARDEQQREERERFARAVEDVASDRAIFEQPVLPSANVLPLPLTASLKAEVDATTPREAGASRDTSRVVSDKTRSGTAFTATKSL